jgi:hypothetical protein
VTANDLLLDLKREGPYDWYLRGKDGKIYNGKAATCVFRDYLDGFERYDEFMVLNRAGEVIKEKNSFRLALHVAAQTNE